MNDPGNSKQQPKGDEPLAVVPSSGGIVWLTGLSGAGKTTIARALEVELRRSGRAVWVLDGDCVRRGLCSDLGFTPADRQENIRRVSLVAQLFADAGLTCIVALISPYRRDRDRARTAAPVGRFLEVFINSSLEVCERRDPKGLYARARAGELRDFTGISAPYEPPLTADVELRTDQHAVGECVAKLQTHLQDWFPTPAVSPSTPSR